MWRPKGRHNKGYLPFDIFCLCHPISNVPSPHSFACV